MAQLQPLCFTELPINGLAIIGLNPSLRKDVNPEDLRGGVEPIVFRIRDIINYEKKDNYHDSLKK
ncbi:MAG: hypothetical protein AAFZ15_33735 [Bacteroidota bacterium]